MTQKEKLLALLAGGRRQAGTKGQEEIRPQAGNQPLDDEELAASIMAAADGMVLAAQKAREENPDNPGTGEERRAFEQGLHDGVEEIGKVLPKESIGEDGDKLFAPEGEQPGYRIVYNGKEIELPLPELLQNAQKGMNYDYVAKQRDALRDSREFSILDLLAQRDGISREELLDRLERGDQELELRRLMELGVPQETIRRFAELAQREIESAGEQRRRGPYAEFLAEFPDVKEFPAEVAEAIAGGKSPLAAYREYENRRLREKLEVVTKQEENKRRTAGSVRSDAPGDGGDAFLAGFSSILGK